MRLPLASLRLASLVAFALAVKGRKVEENRAGLIYLDFFLCHFMIFFYIFYYYCLRFFFVGFLYFYFSFGLALKFFVAAAVAVDFFSGTSSALLLSYFDGL